MSLQRVHTIHPRFNHGLPYTDDKQRLAVLRDLLGSIHEEDPPFIEPPLCMWTAHQPPSVNAPLKSPSTRPSTVVDYGCFTHVGHGFYANAGCTILDCAKVVCHRLLL